jgi:hypothetical protein
MKALLELKEKDEPQYFKEIISSLNATELDDLRRCFQYAEELQRRNAA